MTDSIQSVRNAVNQKLNVSDTALMLSPYAVANNVTITLSSKMNLSDSTSMLQPYSRKVQLTDSILSVRIWLAQKLNVSDSASMLQSYARKNLLIDSVTALRNTIAQKINIADTASMLVPYRREGVKIKDSDLASSYLATTGGVLTGSLSGTTVKLSDTLRAAVIMKTGGTSAQYLMADGSVSSGISAVREVADEFTATAAQVFFTISQTPSANSKVKMYINGVRISNTAYSISGPVLTYAPANNGSYALTAGDRVQFDYYY